jgi:hypothetical protein
VPNHPEANVKAPDNGLGLTGGGSASQAQAPGVYQDYASRLLNR